ncbi:TonB-dependent receptor domain-containing protein [Vibrio metschnikovii]
MASGDNLHLSASYFRNSIKNYISGGVLPKTPGMPEWRSNFTFTNYDKCNSPGWELSAKYHYAWLYAQPLSLPVCSETKICRLQTKRHMRCSERPVRGFGD